MQKFLRRRQVEYMTGLPRSSIYELMGRGEFPKAIKLAPKTVGWIEAEIEQWQRDRVAARDGIAA